MSNSKSKKLIIAGPCAAESKDQVIKTALKLKKLGILGFRACLWKPRTKPGFDGVGHLKGIPWLDIVAKNNLIVATEVLLPIHAKNLVKNLVRKNRKKEFIFWIGARNQNHLIQWEIARILKNEKNVKLMLKNQVWKDEKHWLGIYEHVVSSGFPKERILLCHRGFMPNGVNPLGLRNIPDFEMALKIKNLTQRPMLIDPSHIAGEASRVMEIIIQALAFDFDGFLIEVHPNPSQALSDASQQLTVEQLTKVLKKINVS